MKQKNHDTTEPVDKQRYKKRYLVRILEEEEAEEELKEFKKEQHYDALERFRKEE